MNKNYCHRCPQLQIFHRGQETCYMCRGNTFVQYVSERDCDKYQQEQREKEENS